MIDSLLSHFTGRAATGVSADRRGAEPRETVAWAAELERDGQRVPIEIGNISPGGLMATVDAAVETEARLTVWIDGRRVSGEVRWYGAGRFGLRFDTPIDLDPAVVERYRTVKAEATKQMSRWMI